MHVPRKSSVVYSCSADGTIACFDVGQQKLLSQLAAPEIPYVIKVNTIFIDKTNLSIKKNRPTAI